MQVERREEPTVIGEERATRLLQRMEVDRSRRAVQGGVHDLLVPFNDSYEYETTRTLAHTSLALAPMHNGLHSPRYKNGIP